MSPDPAKPSGLAGKLPRSAWIVLGVAGALLLLVAAGYFLSAGPGYFKRYHVYARSISTLEASGHKDLACDACHVDARGPVVYRAALIGDFYASFFGKPAKPRLVSMPKPTREACLKCHAFDWSDDAKKTAEVPHPAHLRVLDEKRDCVTCHKWTGHEEDYMEKHKAMPFSTVCASFPCHVGFKQATECKSCHHQLQESLGAWKEIHPKTVQTAGPNGCLERCHDADQCRLCHTTGKMPDFKTTIAESAVKAIEREHVKKDWLAKHGTMALDDQSKCMTCHVSETECKDCHSKRPAFHGTDNTKWIGTHKNVSKDERRCLACHEKKWCEECHKQFKEMR